MKKLLKIVMLCVLSAIMITSSTFSNASTLSRNEERACLEAELYKENPHLAPDNKKEYQPFDFTSVCYDTVYNSAVKYLNHSLGYILTDYTMKNNPVNRPDGSISMITSQEAKAKLKDYFKNSYIGRGFFRLRLTEDDDIRAFDIVFPIINSSDNLPYLAIVLLYYGDELGYRYGATLSDIDILKENIKKDCIEIQKENDESPAGSGYTLDYDDNLIIHSHNISHNQASIKNIQSEHELYIENIVDKYMINLDYFNSKKAFESKEIVIDLRENVFDYSQF